MNPWIPKNTTGEMGLGGMMPASLKFNLPATFVVTSEDFSGAMLFCSKSKNKNPGNSYSKQNEVLTWLNQDEIIYKGKRFKLDRIPKSAAAWYVFTLEGIEWKEYYLIGS